MKSMTQQARNLYGDMLQSKGSQLQPGLYRYGWLRRWHWVAKGERAYRVKDMPDEHLKNTILALRDRHPEELRTPLVLESIKRRIKQLKQHRRKIRHGTNPGSNQ